MASMPTPTTAKKKPTKKLKLSRLYKPDFLSLEDWQRELRRQFGRDQQFQIDNQGEHPFFSEFQVMNPQTKNAYRVLIRGKNPGDNFCTCGDFATNTLGTCKHIEFTLGWIENKRGGKKALDDGFQPSYSEVILHYFARSKHSGVPESVADALDRVTGAFSLVMLFKDSVYAIRDPRGFRPLNLGKLNGSYVIASETCAFDLINASYVREIEPGMQVDRYKVHTIEIVVDRIVVRKDIRPRVADSVEVALRFGGGVMMASVEPPSVLEQAQADLVALPGVGASALEVSHRGAWFTGVIEEAEANLRTLLAIPDTHRVLFLQGGASMQFSMVAQNLLRFVLTVRGARQDTDAKLSYHCLEIPYGEFDSEVVLPGTYDEDAIEAKYENGFLRIMLPKIKQEHRVPIRIQAGNSDGTH